MKKSEEKKCNRIKNDEKLIEMLYIVFNWFKRQTNATT